MYQKQCQRCKYSFEIEESDKVFYSKMEVPEPTQCPQCRAQRRMSWRNERGLHTSTCNNCKQSIISRWPSTTKLTVYCNECWQSDHWDGRDYSQDIDWSRSIYEQWLEFIKKVPQRALHITGPSASNENSKYQNCSGENRNCYLVFNSGYNEDVYYSRGVAYCKNCSDLYFSESCELCTNSINAKQCYNTHYSQNVNQCSDSYFLRNCDSCRNCVGCTNLSHKEYHIFNIAYSKEEYEKKLASYKLDTLEGLHNFKEEFSRYSDSQIFPYAEITQCENVSGNYLKECKNVFDSFEVFSSEDLKFAESTKFCKSSMDLCGYGYYSECQYETVGSAGYNSMFCIDSDQANDSVLCHNVDHSTNCFGCSSLKRGEFMIFNKSYSKEEYFELKKKLILALVQEGRWGEFPAIEDSLYDYQDTTANDEYPIESDYSPVDRPKRPDQNACQTCSHEIRTPAQASKLLEKSKLPPYIDCFPCRFKKITELRGPRRLYWRFCNAASCQNQFKTTFAPEDTRQILCHDCYLKEKY